MAIKLETVDYVIFVFVMVVTGLIGLYFTLVGRGKDTMETLFFGNKRIHYIALALSLMASSEIDITTTAFAVFTDGFTYSWLKVLGRVSGHVIMACVYIPVYYRLRLITVYEYLEIRFRKKIVRIIGSVAFIVQTTNYMASAMTVPGRSLVEDLGFDIWTTGIIIGITCTLYTSMGGFKAVIWTDVFQGLIVIIGLLAIVIAGFIEEGGLNRVWKIANEGGRTFNLDWSPDPRVVFTVWTIPVAFTFLRLSIAVGDQIDVQRALSASSPRNSQKAFLSAALLAIIWGNAQCLMGLILYARYRDCDPRRTGIIKSFVGYWMIYTSKVLGNGFPGVLLSAIFCATLSTFSSGVNTLAAVTLNEILTDIPKMSRYITGERLGLWMKLLALGYGVLIIIYALIISQVPLIRIIAGEVSNWTLTPLVGIITLGILSKHANWKGALAGWITGLLFQIWIFAGQRVLKPKQVFNRPRVPKTTTACLGNITADGLPAMEDSADSRNVFYPVYQITYYWRIMLAILVAMLIGALVSYFTGGEDQEKLDPKSVINYREAFCPCRYKTAPLKEDVPNETDQLQQKPVDDISQDTGKLTKISGASKLTKKSKRTSVKNTGENTEQLQENDNVVDEDNIKQSGEEDSGLTVLHSNEAIDQTETLPESSKLQEAAISDMQKLLQMKRQVEERLRLDETLAHLPH